ncbi:MAG: T9SS type A sorting domain-containing protein [Bacteroidota bacterium]
MRNKILRSILALFILAGFQMVQAGQGGPDAYGYIWKDSNEPDVSFNWIDITALPGAVQISGLQDDNSVGPFNIGFSFHYYWTDYSSVKVGSNGWISFDNVGNVASCFPTIPTAGGAGDNLVAPYMSDLSFVSNSAQNPNPGEMWYWTNNVDSFVIQYVNVPWWTSGTPNWIGSNTFELILDATDSSVTFNYLNTDAANLQTNQCPTVMEIGIENLTGNLGLAFSSGATVPASNFAVKYIYPPTVTFQVRDATPVWNINAENAGQLVYTGDPITLSTNVASVGNTDLSNAITVDGEITPLTGPAVWTDNSSIPSLTVGSDQTVTFGTAATLSSAGQYTFQVDITSSEDINPSNNSNATEIAAVDNNAGQVILTYITEGNPTGALSWSGGDSDDGVAVKMIPPGYPLDIQSVDIWIVGDGDINTPLPVGYDLLIVGLDGNGDPDLSNVLQVENLAPANILEDAWNNVALDSSVVIASGGFAVVWYQGGTGIAIGNETTGPISQRSYEILNAAVSPYRDNTVNDFLIRVNGGVPVSIDPASDLTMQITTFPNPVIDLATVAYSVVEPGDVQFSLMNVAGQEVWTKTHGSVSYGDHTFNIDMSDLNAGVYFLNMEQNGNRNVHKIVVH